MKLHPLRDLLSLAVPIQQLQVGSPAIPDDLSALLGAGADPGRERHRLHEGAQRQLERVRDDGVAAVGVDGGSLDAEASEHARHGEEQHPLRDVHALAEPPPRPEPEVVPLRRVVVGRCLPGRLDVVRVSGWVEGPRVGVAVGIAVDCPVVWYVFFYTNVSQVVIPRPLWMNRRNVLGLFICLSSRVGSKGRSTYHTFMMISASFGILYPIYSSSRITECGTPKGVVGIYEQ